jgi:hypothetical protein
MNRLIGHSIRHTWLVVCAMLTLVASGQALAQTQITGTVTVPQGASLEGSQVTAFDPTTNKTFRGTVDAAGKFAVAVEPGTYTVTAVGRGFGPQAFQNVKVDQDKSVTQDVTFAAATPVCIVKAAAPIPLTDDINSAAFADAREITLNSGANIVEGFEGIANYRGPETIGGRVKMKYSDQGLHIAADLTFAKPNTNFGSDTELWKGNSLEIFFQNDPYNATRNAIDPAHNFRAVVGLGEQPRLRMGNNLEQVPQANGAAINVSEYVAVKNREDGKGNLVRVNIPWSFFMTGGDNPAAITAPKDNDMVAIDIRVNNTTPEATAEAPARQFQASASGLGGTDPRALVVAQLCPTAPQ